MSDSDELRGLDLALASIDEALQAGSSTDPTNSDEPTLRGDRGLLHLDRYGLTSNSTDLSEAIEDLTAVTSMIHHPDWPFWCYALGAAYLLRIGEISDEHNEDGSASAEAILLAKDGATWMERAYATGHPDLNRNGIANELAELYWNLYAEERDLPNAADRANQLIDTLCRLRVPAKDGTSHDIWRMYIGAAYEDRYYLGHDRGDLDRAIEFLAPALDRLPMDVAQLPAAYQCLARAYHERYELDGDTAVLEQLVDVAGRGAARTPIDDPTRTLLLRQHAFALWTRFQLVGDHIDRDSVIDTMTDLVACTTADQVDPIDASTLADMLLDRGNDYQSEDDLLAAAHWYRVAIPQTPDDDGTKWLLLISEVETYRTYRNVTGSVDYLKPALDALTEALTLNIPDHNQILGAHLERLNVSRALLDHLVEAGTTPSAETAAPMREVALQAYAALTTYPDSDLELRALVALLAAAALVSSAARDERQPEIPIIHWLLEVARTHPTPSPAIRQVLAGLAVPLATITSMQDSTGPGDFGLHELATVLVELPETSVSAELRSLATTVRYLRANQVGDLRELQRSGDPQATGHGTDDPGNADGGTLDLAQAVARMAVLAKSGDMAAAGTSAQQIGEALLASGESGPSAQYLKTYLDMISAVAELNAGRPFEPLPMPSVRPVDSMFGIFHHLVRVIVTGLNVVAFTQLGDLRAADAAVADLALFVESVPPALRNPHVYVIASAGARLALMARPYDRRLLNLGVAWGEAALRATDAGDVAWAATSSLLATHYRARSTGDDRALSRERGLAAMRGHAWHVLLQSDVDNGLLAAARATSDALMVASWCVDDARATNGASRQRILSQLVQALDAGRALVLHAATATGQVHDELVARGRRDLAVAWQESAHSEPAATGAGFDELAALLSPTLDLRNHVVRALTNTRDTGAGTSSTLLDPPQVADIANALQHSDHDAMVFLIGGPGAERGYAVLVYESGDVDVVDLPALTASDPLEAYLRTHHGSRYGAGPEFEAWRTELDRLCGWAWAAAVEPVLATYLGDRPETLARLVLVPFGALGIVPWHAAWREVNGVRRHVVQDAVISVAASARLWCDAARRPLPLAGTALVLGNPGNNLPSAAVEAMAIHGEFYSDGHYLGQPAEYAQGAGTPTELTTWLGARDAPPCLVLHTASHALVDLNEPANSHLQLAGGVLRTGSLIERLAHGGRTLGTVVLAACTTSVAGKAYDEAMSLSTAFLVAGARAVVGSLWSVPSVSTGLLMFMFHYHLRGAPDQPAEALRRAQLWMLNPDRVYPPEMPAALLEWAPLGRLADSYRWAGFSHLGR